MMKTYKFYVYFDNNARCEAFYFNDKSYSGAYAQLMNTIYQREIETFYISREYLVNGKRRFSK